MPSSGNSPPRLVTLGQQTPTRVPNNFWPTRRVCAQPKLLWHNSTILDKGIDVKITVHKQHDATARTAAQQQGE